MSEFKYKHGLSIMRAQPFHIGHAKMIDKMLRECDTHTCMHAHINRMKLSLQKATSSPKKREAI